MTDPSPSGFERGYYDTVYPNYERQNPPRKMAFYRSLVESVAPQSSTPRILDVGCAFGRFLSFVNPSWQRYGLDVSNFAIEKARTAVSGASFRVSSGTEIPFDGPFDIITAFDVIEHIPSLDDVATMVKRKLTPGGHFVFVVPVYDGPTGPIIRLLDKDTTHVHKDSREFWLNWTKSNFYLIDWWGVYRYLLTRTYYAHIPTKSFRRFTPAIAITARNKQDT